MVVFASPKRWEAGGIENFPQLAVSICSMYGIFTYMWLKFMVNAYVNIPVPWSIWGIYRLYTVLIVFAFRGGQKCYLFRGSRNNQLLMLGGAGDQLLEDPSSRNVSD